MLIMNQSKNEVYNLDSARRIEAYGDGTIIIQQIGDERNDTRELGEYKSYDRAKEVLMELFEQYKTYKAIPNDDGTCGVMLCRAFEMPDK